MLKLKLHWQILIALILAVTAGSLSGQNSVVFGSLKYISIYDFLGKLFLNALKMIIVPLIISSIIVGISSLESGKHLGRLGLKTFVYYISTSLIAVLTGLILVNLVRPGINSDINIHSAVSPSSLKGGIGDLVNVFLRMIPQNIVEAALKGQMLGLIFFSILFGSYMRTLKKELFDVLFKFWDAVFQVMMGITDLIMKFAPIGIFGLVAKVIAETGFESFRPLSYFFFTVLAGLTIHAVIILPLLLFITAKINPLKHFKAMAPALLTAFSTSSSMSTLSVTMDSVKNRVGVSSKTAGFVLPLGATVNMDGTALYECVAAIFIAQLYGISVPFTTQFTVVLLALLTSIGVAGVPSASLVAIIIILGAVGLPAEAVALIMATDRILDMTRTTVNVWSDSCGVAIIAKTEGEELKYDF